MIHRAWFPSFLVALVAALGCALAFLAASWAIAAAAMGGWFDAGFRSALIQTAMQTADLARREHRSTKDVARTVVERLQSMPGVSAVVVDDSGNVLAGDKAIAPDMKFVGGPFLSEPGPGLPPPSGTLEKPLQVQIQSNGPPHVRPQRLENQRFGYVNGPVGFGFDGSAPWGWLFGKIPQPRTFVHIEGGIVAIEAQPETLSRLQRIARLVMLGILGLTFAVVLLATRQTLLGVVRPVERVRSALSKLGQDSQARPEMLGPEDGLAADLVQAYNSAADEISSAYQHRMEVETRLGQFVAEAGHELRTPLAVVMGYVQLLRKQFKSDDAMAQHVFSEIDDQGRRMSVMINKLLLLTRLDTQEPSDVKILDAADVAQSVVESFRPLANGSALKIDVRPDSFVRVSEAEIREAIGNLIDNALKYAPGATVETRVRTDGDIVTVAVADDGPGMSPAVRARAFERFARGETGGAVAGSGLGLSIVKRAAERAGGGVWLNTTPGNGTSVEMRLPAWPGNGETGSNRNPGDRRTD